MKKSLLFLYLLATCFLSVLFADDHRDREGDEPSEKKEKLHRESREIHEAVKEGRISHEEGHKKLEALNRKHQQHEKERFWKRVEEEMEGAVRSGRMTRKQANAEYERIKKTQKQKEEVASANCIEKLRKA